MLPLQSQGQNVIIKKKYHQSIQSSCSRLVVIIDFILMKKLYHADFTHLIIMTRSYMYLYITQIVRIYLFIYCFDYFRFQVCLGAFKFTLFKKKFVILICQKRFLTRAVLFILTNYYSKSYFPVLLSVSVIHCCTCTSNWEKLIALS